MPTSSTKNTGASHIFIVAAISMLLVLVVAGWWLWDARRDVVLLPDTIARGDTLAQKNDPDVGTAGEWVRIAIFSGRASEALTTIRKINESRADALLKLDFLSSVATAFAQAGKPREIRELIAEALPLIQKFQNQPLRTSHLSSFARTLAVAGNTQEALELLKENELWNTNTLIWICWDLSNLGKSDAVALIAADVLAQARQVEGSAERAEALGNAAWALQLAGNTESANTAAEQALALARNLPLQNHKYTLQAVLNSGYQLPGYHSAN